jgi:hypothetical protein
MVLKPKTKKKTEYGLCLIGIYKTKQKITEDVILNINFDQKNF